MSYEIELLDVVAAVRAVLSVAKSLQDKQPNAQPADIAEAVEGAIVLKLAKLQVKGANRTAVQSENMYALKNAQKVLPDVQRILEQARNRTVEEIADGVLAQQTKAAKTKTTRETNAAKKAADKPATKAPVGQKDMFANA